MSRSRLLLARLALATLVPLLFLGGVEFGLWIVGFRPRGPVALGFGSTDPMLDVSESDSDLLWRLVPNRPMNLDGVCFVVNGAGLRGELPAVARETDSLRIVCVGDSTAFGNFTTYPAELKEILSRNADGTKVEVINGGVPGYSAAQGLAFLRRDLMRYRPDVVTWCFGFNNAKDGPGGRTDAETIAALSAGSARHRAWLRKSRLAAWIDEKVGLASATPTMFEHGKTTLRVSPDEYGTLLREAAALCEANGARLVVIEQPHAYAYDDDPNVASEWDEQREEPLRRLSAQNDAAARVCAELSIPFVAMQSEFSRRDLRRLFLGPLPGGDAIHGSPLGLRLFAELLADDLAERGVASSVGAPRPEPRERSAPGFAIADLDSDGARELFAASIVDGSVEVVALDPHSFELARHAAPLPLPTRACAISTLPLLPGQFLLSWRDDKNALRFESWFFDGTPGFIRSAAIDTKLPCEWARVVPVDFDADGAPEYAIQFGPKNGSAYVLFDHDGSPLAHLPLNLAPQHGYHIGTTPHPRRSGAERLIVSGVRERSGVVVALGSDMFPPTASGTFLAIDGVAYSAHDVRVGPDEVHRITFFGPAAMIEREPGDARFLFPWGCSATDIEAPTVGIATTRAETGIENAVLLGSLTGPTLHLARLDSSGWTRLPELVVPAEK
jgi:lysophospholipase L1-like esterase